MKTKLLFFISAVGLSLITSTANSQAESPNVRAALAILDAKQDVERNYQFCRAKAGDYGYKYDYIKYIWELKNRPYIHVSEAVFDTLPTSTASDAKERWTRSSDELRSARSRADNNENGKYCSQYFSQMASGSTPSVSAARTTLAPKLGSREDIRIVERNTDMEVGCVKAGFNSDVKQFEGIRKACDCQTTLIVKKVSVREVDEYLALVSRSKPQDALAFMAKRVSIPELQACYSTIQTN